MFYIYTIAHLMLLYIYYGSHYLMLLYILQGVRDAPLDIWGGGGGGARVFVACKLLPPRENNFFGRSTSDNFFLCFVEEFFCRMLSLLCRLPFGVFSDQHIFHQFRQFFFSAHIFNKLFFLPFVATNIIFNFFLATVAPPPPPDIKWCVPYRSREVELFSGPL